MTTATLLSGREARLGTEELIVSKTDRQGRLTYVNDTFLKVSGYTEKSLIGEPHNVVRHPAMPRAVFRLLWDRLEAGREVFAYVVNKTADGGYYWVFAHVTPSFGPGGVIVGFHSSRRAPSQAALGRVRPLYDRLLAAEAGAGGARAQAEAGYSALQAELEAQGLSYDELIWHITDPTLTGA
ncbi:PAS domain-containing protein [Nocardioides bruguierae]|uniref:PAS domain-containing protein n=1 Tax=Nocardioides bruguierae TaxID=2945102 RepID=A0A9X2D7W5_9ACTN|nr:PAS domain-containing protein [Nocardioides bruguierae]MCL8026730.1 PAS domain-containing protein [Nocardioides bruguierae]MCM0620996.1 PAS domain-containing protein [Nocardioides bruguierae]